LRKLILDGVRLDDYACHPDGKIFTYKSGSPKELKPNWWSGAVVISPGNGRATKRRHIATILLETFKGPDTSGQGRPAFINGDRKDWRIDNLEWKGVLNPPVLGDSESVLPVRALLPLGDVMRIRALARAYGTNFWGDPFSSVLISVIQMGLNAAEREAASWGRRPAPELEPEPTVNDSNPFSLED
jgi:hypothetical protein